MSVAGLLEYNWENPKHEKQYVLPMFVPGSAEFTNMNQKQLDEHPELGRFFERMSREPLEKVTPMVPQGGAGIGMHVIPVEKAISSENQSVGYRTYFPLAQKIRGKIRGKSLFLPSVRAVTFDEGCADDPEDWCIGVGDMADYLVETNKRPLCDTMRRSWRSYSVRRITDLFIRSQTLTARTRFLPSVTVM